MSGVNLMSAFARLMTLQSAMNANSGAPGANSPGNANQGGGIPNYIPQLGGGFGRTSTASSAATGTHGAGGGGSSGGDINQKAEEKASKLGMTDKLESGGDENDIKKVMEDEGAETETVNSPTESTVKSKMGEQDVTGGVILIPGHAVSVKPGDDGKEAVHQERSGSCWMCSALKATEESSGSSGGGSKGGEPTVYDSGDGQKKKPGDL